MSLFILRFILFSGLLYFSYKVLFSKKSFFGLNRTILLFIPLVSFLIPAFAPSFNSPFTSDQTLSYLLPEVNITGTIYDEPVEAMANFNFWWLLYSIGAASVLSLLIIGLVKAWRILRASSHAFDNVHFSEKAQGPFAFFEDIVIPTDLAKSEQLASVIAHEKAHVDQKHAFDNFYYNILSALFWFNPFIHLLQAELRQTHECQADQKALDQSDPENYSRLILGTVFGSEISFDPANRFFNSSLIKTRITMIYKAKTNPVMKGLYLLLIPMIGIMSVASCQKTEDASIANTKATEFSLDKVDRAPVFHTCDPEADRESLLACFTQGIMTFVGDNFKYPASAKDAGIEGKIYVEFNITKEGYVRVVGFKSEFTNQGESSQVAAEAENYATDLISSLPQMQPATHNGKPVAITMTLPIALRLE